MEDRRENLLAAGKSRLEHGTATMAFDADGMIRGAYLDFVSDCGAYPTPWPVSTAAAVGMLFPGPYRVPRAGFTTKCVYTNTVGRAAYRGPWQYETLAREVLLDIAARRIGLDPVELRRRNLLQADELPYRNPNGMTYDHISPTETFEQALAILDYDAFRAEQATARAAGRYLGVGTSSYVEPSTPGFGSYGTEAATIRIEPSGKVNVYIAGGSTGNSIETTVVQLTADALGADIEDVAHDPGRHCGHRFRGGHRGQPQRVDDGGRGRSDRGDPARAAVARSRRTVSKPRSTTSSSKPAAPTSAARRPSASRSRSSPRSRTSNRTRCRPGSRPGSKRARATRRRTRRSG